MEYTEYIEFELDGEDHDERLVQLQRFVGHLRSAKATGEGRQTELTDVEPWLALLPIQFKAGFVSSSLASAWLPPGGFSEPGWDVESMLEALLHGEYELSGVDVIGRGVAELRFLALAFPYGGVGSLVRLVEGFGFRVRAVDDGCGPEHWTRPGG